MHVRRIHQKSLQREVSCCCPDRYSNLERVDAVEQCAQFLLDDGSDLLLQAAVKRLLTAPGLSHQRHNLAHAAPQLTFRLQVTERSPA